MASLEELMSNLPPADASYQEDVYAPMREFQNWFMSRPPVDVEPFFQAMQSEPSAPVPQMSVPGAVPPLNQFLALLGGNMAAAQSGNQQFASAPLETLQGRQQERDQALRANEGMKIQAAQQEYERSRQLKLKMHEMKMQQAIKRGDLEGAAKENEAKFKMLDLQRQEEARIAQEQSDRDLMLKTAAQVEVEKVKGEQRQETERVKGQIKKETKDGIANLPKEGQIELTQRLQGIRAVYAAQAAMGFPVDQPTMQKEMEDAADEIIAKHKGEKPVQSTEDKVRARARELKAARNKKGKK